MLKKLKKSKNKKYYLFFLILPVLFLLWFFIEPLTITIKEYTISSSEIPVEFDNYEIIFLSDIHCNSDFNLNRIKNFEDKVNTLNADMIILGGDYANRNNYLEPVFKSIGNIKAKDGIYGVLGNYDYTANTYKGYDEIRDVMHKYGITPLINDYALIKREDKTLKIIGIEYLLYIDKGRMNELMLETNDSNFVILASHSPDVVYYIENMSGIDLILSGHTHGGQVTLFGKWTSDVFVGTKSNYLSGLYIKDNTNIIVSNGIGTSIFPIRFFSFPQIVKITLKKIYENDNS